jgi:MoxR-like ATPase
MKRTAYILNDIVENMEKVIIGKRDTVELVIISLLCNGHVLIEDVPGVGKTSLVSALAKSIDSTFKRIQFTPDIMPTDITGFSIFNGNTGEFEYRPGSIMSQIILADEINRTSPKTQASLLEVMEENQVTVDGITYKVPQPFMVLATQNPVEYIGTYPLPEAQLDRFFMKISIGYPLPEEEKRILSNLQLENPIESLNPVIDSNEIIFLQQDVKNVYLDGSIRDYIVEIIGQTRNHPDILLGSSPRGSISLFKASQAWAYYNNRNYVIPDDVKKMAIPVLSHRIVLSQEARIKRLSSEGILNNIIENIRIPVVN